MIASSSAGRSRSLLVLLADLDGRAWGVWSLAKTPLDAIPDLSERAGDYPPQLSGAAPRIVEDQITFPLNDHAIGPGQRR